MIRFEISIINLLYIFLWVITPVMLYITGYIVITTRNRKKIYKTMKKEHAKVLYATIGVWLMLSIASVVFIVDLKGREGIESPDYKPAVVTVNEKDDNNEAQR